MIYLDWDVSFRYWSSHTRDAKAGKRSKGWMKNRLRLFEKRWWVWDKIRVLYRRSGSGRVHVSLEHIPPNPSMVERDLLLRALLLDDPARVYLDIVRWCQGEPTNRLFDVKYSDGKIRKAGPWVKWFVIRPGKATSPSPIPRRRTMGTPNTPATGEP